MFQQQQPTPTWQQFCITAHQRVNEGKRGRASFPQAHSPLSHSPKGVGRGEGGTDVGLKRKRNRN